MADDPRVILVVEDEPLIRMVAVDCLEDLGFQVLEAGSASEAWAIVLELPQLWALFTDVEMPGPMDGVALAHLTRLAFPEAHVLVSSGRRLPKKEQLPTRTRFLAKPYGFDDLRFFIEDVGVGSREGL
jgi:two-component system, response regulator PdtaR